MISSARTPFTRSRTLAYAVKPTSRQPWKGMRSSRRMTASPPRAAGPPLEQVAADLRRLVAEHRRVVDTRQLPARGRRLVALEGALTDRALDAARALELDVPGRPTGGPLPVPALRDLLLDLQRAGVVLPDVEHFGRGRG